MKDRVINFLAFTFALILTSLSFLVLFWVDKAYPHSWYPFECCSNRDCAEVIDWKLDLKAQGVWATTQHGTVFITFEWLNKNQRPSQDWNHHVCMVPLGDGKFRVLCVFLGGGV